MDKHKLLSGEELVARGITKIDVNLPEIGLKDVVPNGSWLEQKQIQSALEARKHMIEVQRIEKSCVLSQAEWHEELMLAEVSKIVGGHWQYLGHNIGKQLYLRPEEALYLIEVNCLRLTYNGVAVSLQQAYSLLLRSEISMMQYKVYASLSRIGYKVFRHENKKKDESNEITTENEKDVNETANIKEEIQPIGSKENEVEDIKETKMIVDDVQNEIACSEKKEDNEEVNVSENANKCTVVDKQENKMDVDEHHTGNKSNTINEPVKEENVSHTVVDKQQNKMDIDEAHNGNETNKSIESDKEVYVPQSLKEKIVENREPVKNKAKGDDKICNENYNNIDGNSNGFENNTEVNESCNKTGKPECTNSNSKTSDTEMKEDNIKDIIGIEIKDTSETILNEDAKENTVKSTFKDVDMESCNDTSTDKEIKEASNKNNKVLDNNRLIQTIMLSECNYSRSEHYHQYKIRKIESRKLKPLNVKTTEKCFENIADLTQNHIVTVNAPDENLLPRHVFLNNISYTLNLENFKGRNKETGQSYKSRAFSTNEDVNGEHIKRIKAAASTYIPVNTPPPPFTNIRFNRPTLFNFWRPNMNFFPYNFMFRPPPFIPHNFMPRLRVFNPRPPLLGEYPRFASFQSNEQRSVPNQNRKRRISAKQKENHLQAIKNLALRLKELIQSGNTQQQNIDSLQRLINTFNIKYSMRLRLTEDFDIFNNETILETISLDEDEEPISKKSKPDDDNKYKENFNALKQLAFKLKGLEAKEQVTSRHRRAFSSLIKKFNKSYDADIYINMNFEIIDRKLINLDSSSDSDCVIEESTKAIGSKKLKNPFNILKRLSEKRNVTNNSDANKHGTKDEEMKSNNYSKTMIECFSKDWLPSEDDFGRAEIIPKSLSYSYLLHSKREEFLYEFIKSQPFEFENWVDIKLSFLKTIEETDISMENDMADATAKVNSLVEPEDCTDTSAVLKKLSIIGANKEVDSDSSLKIDFDVYNRDVKNFKKSCRPTPHFRVICISETSSFPSGKDVASHHSKYNDNITLVFAVVGIGSISYLQINPIDLPIYIPASDLE